MDLDLRFGENSLGGVFQVCGGVFRAWWGMYSDVARLEFSV